ncbi:flavin monoamine oxidase family protein [Aeromicrobium sp.]|uniref:flavin monoamine oxidase family protein n=1 Tax=Aeromicrobium sp. TaxID=1871063 RepID=UPI003D6B43B6
MRHDAIVVGAGVAGLTAADRLVAAGRDAIVLEARERVGGRTLTVDVPGVPGLRVDSGGQWVGPGQHALLAELERFGLYIIDQAGGGQDLVSLGGGLSRYTGSTPRLGPITVLDVGLSLQRFEKLATSVDLDRPWATPNADVLDGQTFETWILDACRTKKGREFFRICCEAVFATEATNVSLLHALFYSHSGGGLEHLISTEGGAQHARVDGGMQQLSEHLASGLGDRVRLDEPVTAIAVEGTGVRITTERGTREASRVIVAVPPTLAGRLHFEPVMPGTRDALTQRMPQGSVIKCHAVYDRPFWRDAGLSGEAVGDTAPVKVVFDGTPPGDGSPGVLVAFIEAADAIRLSAVTPDERQAEVLDVLAHYFGDDARHPVAFVERDWSAERWTRGCYGAHLPPGAWTQVGTALREPVGPIHWAGTETAERWCGYIDGAITSGERAAAEVDAALPRSAATSEELR